MSEVQRRDMTFFKDWFHIDLRGLTYVTAFVTQVRATFQTILLVLPICSSTCSEISDHLMGLGKRGNRSKNKM